MIIQLLLKKDATVKYCVKMNVGMNNCHVSCATRRVWVGGTPDLVPVVELLLQEALLAAQLLVTLWQRHQASHEHRAANTQLQH